MVRWKNIYQGDDQYFEFLKNQVREMHMERSQGIYGSVFRALTGRGHKTRRRQVTSILPKLVTMGSTTPTTVPDA